MSATDRIRFRLPRRTAGEWSGIGFAGIDPSAIGIVVADQGHPFPEVAPQALNMDDVALICELVNNAEALCDLADQAKKIESLLDALVFPLREEWPLTSKAVEQHRDSLGETLSRLKDKEIDDGRQ